MKLSKRPETVPPDMFYVTSSNHSAREEYPGILKFMRQLKTSASTTCKKQKFRTKKLFPRGKLHFQYQNRCDPRKLSLDQNHPQTSNNSERKTEIPPRSPTHFPMRGKWKRNVGSQSIAGKHTVSEASSRYWWSMQSNSLWGVKRAQRPVSIGLATRHTIAWGGKWPLGTSTMSNVQLVRNMSGVGERGRER